ncbi:MAG: SpaA isopeptide-forming pilin-related protein [Candidatus Fimivicinus sp.]|nr:VWA domain-containing protein [Oscillospiraceae bacterium]MDY5591667.1 SpaA isopeptide-forming pilin-related protein [Candidatus Fimivicinus sp.]
MKSKKQARIWARLCALALIAVMLLTSAYAGGVIPPAEAEAASAAAEGKNTALAAETVDSESPEDSLGEPVHRKYIKDNGDGTYQLSLDVTGNAIQNEEHNRTPVDVIVLADTSSSMRNNSRLMALKKAATELSTTLLTTENASLPEDEQIQMALISFSDNASIKQSFTTNNTAFQQAVSRLSAKGNTYWDKALSMANNTNSGRANAQKYIIFLSDGDPAASGVNWTQTIYTDAVALGRQIVQSGDIYLYSIGIEPSSMSWVKPDGSEHSTSSWRPSVNHYKSMEAFAIAVNGGTGGETSKYYPADNVDDLSKIFANLAQDIIKNYTYRNVKITDTLSDYAEFSNIDASDFTVTASDGSPLTQEDYTLEIDQTFKTISVQFLKDLEKDVTYTVSFNIAPTQAAYDTLAERNGKYPSTGDLNTDAEGNDTSSGKPGFFANAEAQLSYQIVKTINGEEEVENSLTALYKKPVIQVKLSAIPVKKNWSDGTEQHTEDSVSVHLYQDGSDSPYCTLTLDAENEWKDVFGNLPSGHTYTVQEVLDGNLASAYDASITPVDGINLEKGDTNTGSEAQRFTITNTLKVASFTIKKVDKENPDKPLEGATFELVKADENWDPIDQENPVAIEATGEDSKATFNDIPFGNYLLYETKAPAGYKLPKDPVRVTVEAGMVTLMNVNGETIGTVTPPTEGESTSQPDVTIPNKENDKLPVAGGAGTLWFTGGGLALAGAAALLYFKQRRKKGEE